MKNWTRRGMILSTSAVGLSACTGTGSRDPSKLDKRVDFALDELRTSVPFSGRLLDEAAGVLIIPQITKAGLGWGGAYGEGALRIGDATVDYYSVAAASFGLQIGVQSYSSALFFSNAEQLQKFRARDGWTLGADLEYAAIEGGETVNLDTNTARDTVYSIVYGQVGLHVGATIEGSKYSRILRE